MSVARQRCHLTTFDRCHDTDDADGILVVLDILETRADGYELTDGITVADIHDSHPPSDNVVVCAYERALDNAYPNWRSHARALAGPERYEEGVDLLYYPAGKLELYTAGNFTERGDDCFCEHCDTPVPSSTDWVEHVVTECPGA